MYLKQIRARTNARIQHSESCQPAQALIDLLWLAYLMMTENDGKNEQQLLDYAEMDAWLIEYWFDDEGASLATHTIVQHAWPIENEQNSIAMWLLWFLLRPGTSYLCGSQDPDEELFTGLIVRNVNKFPYMTMIVKLTALAANRVSFLIDFFVFFFSYLLI